MPCLDITYRENDFSKGRLTVFLYFKRITLGFFSPIGFSDTITGITCRALTIPSAKRSFVRLECLVPFSGIGPHSRH